MIIIGSTHDFFHGHFVLCSSSPRLFRDSQVFFSRWFGHKKFMASYKFVTKRPTTSFRPTSSGARTISAWFTSDRFHWICDYCRESWCSNILPDTVFDDSARRKVFFRGIRRVEVGDLYGLWSEVTLKLGCLLSRLTFWIVIEIFSWFRWKDCLIVSISRWDDQHSLSFFVIHFHCFCLFIYIIYKVLK